MRFRHNPQFDTQFAQIPKIVWYPYVGQEFDKGTQRIMVFAHNIAINNESYEAKSLEWKAPATWSEAVEEFTYVHGTYNKAFRSFIKGAVGLTEDYKQDPDPQIAQKIDKFVRGIAYGNFIQGLVRSDTAIATAESGLIADSKAINLQLLKILEITHCICWGKKVFNYVESLEGYITVESEDLQRSGFGYSVVESEEKRRMRVLKIYHPSMPRFGHKSVATHAIFSDFLSKPNP